MQYKMVVIAHDGIGRYINGEHLTEEFETFQEPGFAVTEAPRLVINAKEEGEKKSGCPILNLSGPLSCLV